MVRTDVIEGVVDDCLWYHYDRANDVLYLRLASERGTPTFAAEDSNGILVLRRETDQRVVGMTVVNWWGRFGNGSLPDSLSALERQIELWARKLAA